MSSADNNGEGGRSFGAGSPASRQVNWSETYLFAARLAAQHGVVLDHHLLAGTPQWCGMRDDDARKLLALVLGGVRKALANDTRQTALSDASREISGAAAWSEVGRSRGTAYIPRKAS